MLHRVRQVVILAPEGTLSADVAFGAQTRLMRWGLVPAINVYDARSQAVVLLRDEGEGEGGRTIEVEVLQGVGGADTNKKVYSGEAAADHKSGVWKYSIMKPDGWMYQLYLYS